MSLSELQRLSFDLYERYILLEQIGKVFRPSASPYRVLDVGGHTPAFWPGFPSLAGALMPDATVAVVDVIPQADLCNYVRASGLQLPFRDGAFDLVCSLDTLEHLPDNDRPALLAELLRVTRDGLYVAFPFDSASTRWAESVIVEYTGEVLRAPVPALLEHRQFGLPERDRMTGLLRGAGFPLIQFEQGNTDVWLLMMLTHHALHSFSVELVRQLNQRFNQTYAARDWAAPAYRAAYVLSKLRPLAELQALQASFGGGPGADLQAVLALCQLFLHLAQSARGLAAKDRHIQHLEAELEQARAAANELRAERTAVESKLEGLSRQVAEFRSAVEEQVTQLNSANLASLVSVYDRMKELEIGLLSNRRDVRAIYESRIWKTLSGAGGALLRWTGRAPGASRPPSETAGVAGAQAGGEDIELVCDEPGTAGVRHVREIAEVRGWALAESGIARVMVAIHDRPAAPAAYGIPRPDVARSHPEAPAAERSGYQYFWDTTSVPDGPCTVKIIAVTNGGGTLEAVCKVVVDQKATPDYELWIARNEPMLAAKRRLREQAENLPVQPTISIVMPVANTPLDLLERSIESVRAQLYPHWQFYLAGDGANDPRLAERLLSWQDPRIRAVPGAANAALALGEGEYLALLDGHGELADFALSEVVRAINEDPATALYYADEDKLDERGRRYDVFFKPGWSPDLLLSCNYPGRFLVFKREVLEQVKGLDESYNGSAQYYDFLLRASEHTRNIRRIPKVLYHWRAAGDVAAGAEASAEGRRALEGRLARQHPGATAEEIVPGRYRVHYPIAGNPRVTILMPTGGNMQLLRAALEDVLQKTSYKNYDILLIDNSRAGQVEKYAAKLARTAPVRYLDWRNQPFNYSIINNEGARRTDSPYILLLNDDMTIITPEWMTAMLEHAQRPEAGAVGALLLYPDDTIQHGGVVMGIYGNTSHAFKRLPAGRIHYFNIPNVIRDSSAVTAACLLVAREKFFEAGGFDEVNLAVAFQDVDLCLKLLDLGYYNVYTPHARLYHYESVTKAEKIPNAMEDGYMRRRWAKYIADDPYYNPNLTRRREDFSIRLD